MSMGDVFAFFGAMLALGIAVPGMLLAWSLLFPNVVERARLRLEQTPWRCFWLGAVALGAGLLVAGGLTGAASGPGQMLGWVLFSLLIGFISVGAAGIAALMGGRLSAGSAAISGPGALLRGAVALEMAAIFPLAGWFVVVPLAATVALGAATFALLGWMPRRAVQRTPIVPPAAAQPWHYAQPPQVAGMAQESGYAPQLPYAPGPTEHTYADDERHVSYTP